MVILGLRGRGILRSPHQGGEGGGVPPHQASASSDPRPALSALLSGLENQSRVKEVFFTHLRSNASELHRILLTIRHTSGCVAGIIELRATLNGAGIIIRSYWDGLIDRGDGAFNRFHKGNQIHFSRPERLSWNAVTFGVQLDLNGNIQRIQEAEDPMEKGRHNPPQTLRQKAMIEAISNMRVTVISKEEDPASIHSPSWGVALEDSPEQDVAATSYSPLTNAKAVLRRSSLGVNRIFDDASVQDQRGKTVLKLREREDRVVIGRTTSLADQVVLPGFFRVIDPHKKISQTEAFIVTTYDPEKKKFNYHIYSFESGSGLLVRGQDGIIRETLQACSREGIPLQDGDDVIFSSGFIFQVKFPEQSE